MGPELLDTKAVKPGEDACEAQVGNNAVHWHHYEAGGTNALPVHWDRYLFRIMCYLETSLVHESVKSKIFNMGEIKRLSDNIKSEALAYKLSMEDLGQKPGEIAQDVIPTLQSYREAVSPPPKRRAPAASIIAPRAEKAGNSQASGFGLPRGENAGNRQSSESGLPRGDNAGNSQSLGSGAPRGNAPPSLSRRPRTDPSRKRRTPLPKKWPKGSRRSCISSPTCTARTTRGSSIRRTNLTSFRHGPQLRIWASASCVTCCMMSSNRERQRTA